MQGAEKSERRGEKRANEILRSSARPRAKLPSRRLCAAFAPTSFSGAALFSQPPNPSPAVPRRGFDACFTSARAPSGRSLSILLFLSVPSLFLFSFSSFAPCSLSKAMKSRTLLFRRAFPRPSCPRRKEILASQTTDVF